MNWFYLSIVFTTNSQEQRERIFEEIHKRLDGNNRYQCSRRSCEREEKSDSVYKDDCIYYNCNRTGECEISFDVAWKGFFFYDDVSMNLCYLPREFPDVTVEEWLDSDLWGTISHKIYHNDYWENIWTLDDAVYDWTHENGFKYPPSNYEYKKSRQVYDYNDRLISEESEAAPLSIELLPDDVREEFESWKEFFEHLEKDRRKEKEGSNNDDDLSI